MILFELSISFQPTSKSRNWHIFDREKAIEIN